MNAKENALHEWLHLDASSEDSDQALHSLVCASQIPVREGFKAETMEALVLDSLLRGARIPVREGFKEGVMASLPASPAWSKAPTREPAIRWALPVAAMAVFAFGAMALLSGTSGSGHILATGGAILDLFTFAMMAGAGLFTASWSGLGAAVGSLLAGDPGSLMGFGVLVLFANLLFFSVLRRRRPETEAVRESASGDT